MYGAEKDNSMRIIAILEVEINAGGGFNQSLNALLQAKAIFTEKFDFEVITTKKKNLQYLAEFEIKANCLKVSLLDRFLQFVSDSSFWHSIQSRLKMVGPFEKFLIKNGCDLVYFVSPSNLPSALQKLNFITTIWDNAHRDTPEFPEVREFGVFQERERSMVKNLLPAYRVLVDSPDLGKNLINRYGIDEDKLIVMPFKFNPFFVIQANGEANDCDIDNGDGYLYYPAQFWPHKNHIKIIEAIKILKEDGLLQKVIFSGRDGGSLSYLTQMVSQYALDDLVKFVGFLTPREVRRLYSKALAVIMPTYFGPTNIPPLEAWKMGKPLICSNANLNQVADAAVLIDPDSVQSIAQSIRLIHDAKIRKELVAKGYRRLGEISVQTERAEKLLFDSVVKFQMRRLTWPAGND